MAVVSLSWWDSLITYFKSFGEFARWEPISGAIISYAIKIIIFQKLKSLFPLKLRGLELKFVHNTNINMLIAVSLSLFRSLYGLQKPR